MTDKQTTVAPAIQKAIAAVTINPDGSVASMNDACAGFLADNATDCTGKNWLDALTIEDVGVRAAASSLFNHAKSLGKAYSCDQCCFAIGANHQYAAITFIPEKNGAMRLEWETRHTTTPHLDAINTALIEQHDQAIVLFTLPAAKQVFPTVSFVNDQFEAITGYNGEEFERAFLQGLTGPATDPRDMRRLVNALAQNKPCRGDIQLYHKNGNSFWAQIDMIEIDHQKKLWMLIFDDINARKEQESLLEKNIARLEATLESIGEGIITTDENGRITMINPAAEKLLGLPLEMAQGKAAQDVFPLFHQNSDKPVDPPLMEAFQKNCPVHIQRTVVLQADDRPMRHILCSAAPIHGDKRRIAGGVIVFRDVHEMAKMDEELQKAQKMESIGVVTGGVAHDFNNILTGILGSISLALTACEPDSPVATNLQRAERASVRAKDLTMQLLAFSKGGAPVKSSTNMAGLLRESTSFVMSGSTCASELEVPEKLWSVDADESQVSQVLHNLLINAVQAMEGNGTVRVVAENTTVKKDDLSLPIKPGRYVRVQIIDSGCGISRANLPKVFDPYYTTKDKGNGLGLATSYTFIQAHGGHIEVDSEPGEGSTFTFYLPATQRKPISQSEREEKVFHGSGRILVLDDEEIIQAIAGDLLRHLGYEPHFASSAKECIDAYIDAIDEGNPFDAVILDLTIPGSMSGKETMAKLQEIDGDVRAILTTGYANDPILNEYKDYGFRGVIVKPYNVGQLSWVLYDTLHD